MALFNECRERHAHIALDTADIVRDGDFSPTSRGNRNSVQGRGGVRDDGHLAPRVKHYASCESVPAGPILQFVINTTTAGSSGF